MLIVHHTVNGNGYARGDVAAMLRQIHRFHTGPEKGWPDIAYNFVVDRFGGIWETRAGSLDGTVAGDATGGNQGYDQKCAFLGDHRTEPPTPEAEAAMTALLAWLADRSGVDTRPGAQATFVSRGSNRWPEGSTVTVPTITGHRDVSSTTCPGEAGMDFVVRARAAVGPSDGETNGPGTTATTEPVATSTTGPDTNAPGTSGPEATAGSSSTTGSSTTGAPSPPTTEPSTAGPATSGTSPTSALDGTTLPSASPSSPAPPTTVAAAAPVQSADEGLPPLAVIGAGLGIAGVGAALALRTRPKR